MTMEEAERLNAPPDVLYIAGYGRSGSTLLECLLDVSPRTFGGGELVEMLEFLAGRERRWCACGEEADSCLVWGEVKSGLKSALGLDGPEDIGALHQRIRWCDIAGPAARAEAKRLYRRAWDSVLENLSGYDEGMTVIDSSKSTRRAGFRPWSLSKLLHLRVGMIHLTRDPTAVRHSLAKGSNRGLNYDVYRPKRRNVERGTIGWCAANFNAEMLRSYPGVLVSSLHLRYEDLVDEPYTAIERIEDLFHMDLSEAKRRVLMHEELDSGHGIGGNRFRRASGIRLTRSERAPQRRLGWRQWDVRPTYVLGRRYGYPIARSGSRAEGKED